MPQTQENLERMLGEHYADQKPVVVLLDNTNADTTLREIVAGQISFSGVGNPGLVTMMLDRDNAMTLAAKSYLHDHGLDQDDVQPYPPHGNPILPVSRAVEGYKVIAIEPATDSGYAALLPHFQGQD